MRFEGVAEEQAAICRAQLSPLSKRDKEGLQQEWRVAFAPEVKLRTGKWSSGGYDWHAFSSKMSRALSDGRAEEEYRNEDADELILLPEIVGEPAFIWRGNRLPDFGRYVIDVSVSPPGFDWTMVYTHEADCGPYFSRRQWHDDARTEALGLTRG